MTTRLILACYINGLPHRIRDSNLDVSTLAIGDEVNFVHDSENPYDPMAVKVYHSRTGADLGFIPRETTPVWHESVAKGETITAVIHEMPMQKFKEVIIHGTIPL